MGDDWIWRGEKAEGLTGDDWGEFARSGDDDNGEGTTGRWFQLPVKMGGVAVGAKDSILAMEGCLSSLLAALSCCI